MPGCKCGSCIQVQVGTSKSTAILPPWLPWRGWSIHTKGYLIYTSRSTRPGIKRGSRAHRMVIDFLAQGEVLDWEFHVHHQDWDKLNNCPLNLIRMPMAFNPSTACKCPYTGLYISAARMAQILGR